MANFRDNILRMTGCRGEAWLDNLPNLTRMLAAKWELNDCQPIPIGEMNYHHVFKAYQGKTPVMVKIGLDAQGLKTEVLALEAYDGQGCVKLLAHDFELGALLLQQATPGTPLVTLFPEKDSDAVKITALVIEKLHGTLPSDKTAFPTVKDWLSAFDNPNAAELPMLHKAKTLAKQLLKTSEKSVLLHGDLHHDNILYNGASQWLAIDPKGVLGEPAFEVGAFIRNPISKILTESNLISFLEKRITCFAKYLNLEPWRLRDWSFVQCILAACWNIEDNIDPAPWLMLGEVLHEIPTKLLLK